MVSNEMWQAHRTPLAEGGERISFGAGGVAMTIADVFAGWRDDARMRAFTIDALAAFPYPALFWEMPPLATAAMTQPYECVLLPAPALARVRPDPAAFAEHFAAAPDALVTTFANLGGDAWLIAPCPQAPSDAYGHLAAFLRRAPADQQHALFETLGRVVPTRIGPRPLWLSTSGLGVPWLHLRLDERPKYFHHRAYTIAL